jgi:hypothetical protein
MELFTYLAEQSCHSGLRKGMVVMKHRYETLYKAHAAGVERINEDPIDDVATDSEAQSNIVELVIQPKAPVIDSGRRGQQNSEQHKGAARAPEISVATGAWDDELANNSKQDNTSLDDDEDEDAANQEI